MNSELHSVVGPLDEAHAHRLKGDKEGAMRLCIALLDSDVHQVGPATLLARIVEESGQSMVAGEVIVRAVDAYIRRGDLPSAAACVRFASDAGHPVEPLRKQIAAAFGLNSPRTSPDVSPTPPPLPKPITVPPALTALKGAPLLERAEATLSKFLASTDPIDKNAKVPVLPLFGGLTPQALEQLLSNITFEEIPQGVAPVRQGEEGREMFVVVRGVMTVTRENDEGQKTTLAALGPGAIFGEMALMSDAPRAATVTAAEPAQLLSIHREDLEKLASQTPVIGEVLGGFCRNRMLGNLIRTSPMLSHVPPSERLGLIQQFETRVFEPGDVMVENAKDAPGLFLIASGSVRIAAVDTDGELIHVGMLGPGDLVGEMSVVLRRPSSAHVLANHPTVALFLSRERFHEVIRDYPTLLTELYDLAAKRDEQMRSVVGQETLDADDVILV